MIAAGSVITKDVAIGDLAISRSKQMVLKDGSLKFQNRAKKK
jgi:bifunctional N-acetylglucosamine-1-phosphate-uridyltransferase/glucosamine-1-phosphate-acetyltransferase GlmU-like protein